MDIRHAAAPDARQRRGTRAAAVLNAAAVAVCLAAASTAAISAGPLAPSAAQPQQDTSFTVRPVKSRLGLISATDPSLLGRSDSTPINVVVKLDYDAAASYLGNMPGLAATSPRRTGRKLKDNQAAVAAYTAWAADYERQVLDRVRARVPAAQARQSYRAVYGGVSMTVPANAIGTLLSVDGVVAVQPDSLEMPLTSVTPDFVGASSVWPALGGSTKAGEGVIVGILDTGIWPEHPSFADHGLAPPPGGPFQCRFGGASGDASFTCNKKLIGAYAFLNTYLAVYGPDPAEFCVGSVCSARDAEGHGTHTASTAAGGPVDNTSLLGVNRGHVSGMAPGAHVIMYRVCRVNGCYSSDSVDAVNQAIQDGVDVINFSISGGANAYTDPVELAFLDAYEAGIVVNASAGNNGPGAATANHAGPWTNTVGAATSNRHYFSTLRLTAANGDTLDIPGGVTVTAGVTAVDVVLAQATAADPNRLCLNAAAPGTYTAKVVVCQRGVNARVDKGYNVLQGGAAGMILYNPTVQQLNSDNHWLPSIHLEGPAAASSGGPADRLLSFLSSHTGVKATWTNGTETTVRGDVTASFSSRGPLGDFIKPDVTAPGVQILAGHTPQPVGTVNGPPGQFYQAIAGTSMSSPHSAGVAALVKAAHPSWTPGQIKSALMTSSVQDVLKEDGVTPATPFDRGAGSIRAHRAVSPTVTFDVGSIDYLASATDPLGRIDLNLPSVNAPTMSGEITTWRTMRNVTGEDQPLDVSVQAPSGAEIIVARAEKKGGSADKSDRTIAVEAGAERMMQVTIKAPTLANGQYFGQITLTPKKKGYSPVVIPVAFNKRQGQVSLAHSCAPSSFTVAGSTTCTVRAENFSPGEASVDIEVDASKGLEYSNVSAPATLAAKDVIRWSGTLIAPLPPQIDIAVAPGSTPAGFLPLSMFGITPIAGAGDESIVNFNVPTFSYGAENYTRIGIVSNGYIVIGGGDSGDVNYLNQSLPNPTRPNNVLAPFWTDLNPATGGALRIGSLTDGVSTWLVIEFNGVREYSTATKTVSFQTWIRLGTTPASEEVTVAYGPIAGGASGDGGLLTVGAENRTGSSGRNLYYNGAGTLPATGTELKVSAVPPAGGGVVQFTYSAAAKQPGGYTSTANLTSNATPGVTQDVETLTVTP